MLLEISSLLLVDEHQVQEVAALESVVYVWVCGREVRTREVEPNGNALSLDRRSVHNLELIEVLGLGNCSLTGAHDLFSYYTELHVLDFDSHQVEVDLAENAVLEVEFTLVEFELDVQTLLYADLHFDWLVRLRLLSLIADNKLLLLGDFIIVPVDDHVDVVPQPYHDAVVGLKLLLDSVELEIV